VAEANLLRPGDAAYAEAHWVDRHGGGDEPRYDLLPGVPRKLDRYVTRLIAPNPGVMTGPGTNTYLVGERELAVIDPGPEDAAHVRGILAAGAGRIRWILCSHTHLDHASATLTLQKATGARIAAMAPAPPTASTGAAAGAGEHNMRLVLDRALADGDSLELDGVTLRAVFTPGHASNHLCFLLTETGMLFSGDHIMQGSTVVIAPPDGNMRDYLQSLRRLLRLDIAVLAPGHGYLIGHPHAEAERLIQHRLARESKVRQALLDSGAAATLESLLPRVYNDVSPALHPIALRSLQAHLEKLVEDGEVTCDAGRYSVQKAGEG
jgi:glyoxylase-like metal-dependent hydrolase (beta-lactamase superfamily II)